MDLTKQEVRTGAQKIYDMFFQQNSILDNVANYLDISCNMPDFAEFIHIKTSHPQPIIADQISDFAKLRGTRIGRGALLSNTKEYINAVDAMTEALNYSLEIEQTISQVIDLCIELNDKMFEDFFRNFEIEQVAPFTHQFAKFIDGLKDYEENGILSSFNHDFVSYITLKNSDDDDND